MRSPATEQDLLRHLRQECVEGVEDEYGRIQVYMDGVREDLESAGADLAAFRSRTATSDLEDAAMLMGEALGFALGFRVPAGEGHHWRAIRLLTLYLQVRVRELAREAAQLELLRSYRHRVKYEGAEAPAELTRMYYAVVEAIYRRLKDEPMRLLSERTSGQR